MGPLVRPHGGDGLKPAEIRINVRLTAQYARNSGESLRQYTRASYVVE